MKTVKHPWSNPIDVGEADAINKYTNQIQGLAALFSSLDIDAINQDEFSGAAWALNEIAGKLGNVVGEMMGRENAA